jgi:O-antigen/teichoic acid export membrane protein
MLTNPLEGPFLVAMLSMVAMGAYCAYKLDHDHPLWVRLIVLAPAIIGMFAPVVILMGIYVPYILDVIFAGSVALLYALVSSRFSDNPWLDIRSKEDALSDDDAN